MSTNLLEPAPSAPSDAAIAGDEDGEFVLTDASELSRFGAAWDAVPQLDPSPVQGFDWSRLCARALAADGQARVMISARAGQPLAAAPFVADSRSWPGRWRLIGVDQLYEPSDLVYADAAGLGHLVKRLADLRRPLVLGRVPADSLTVAALTSAFAGRGVVVVRPERSYPYITLDESWQQPEQKLSSRRRSDLRRALKRAEEMGPVTSEIVTPGLDELDHLLEQAFAVEARSWKGAAGTALTQDAFRARFYRRYAFEACARGTLRMAWLRIGDTVAAMQISVEHRRRLWLLKIGYDEQFARTSPGSLLTARTIEYAARRELLSYEFLGTSESWTEMWTSDERKFVSLRIYPYSARGMSALAIDGVRSLRRRLSKGK